MRLEERARNDQTGATAATITAELGVSPRTAHYRLQGADAIESHADLAAAVDSGRMEPEARALIAAASIPTGCLVARKEVQQRRERPGGA